ncbi:protein FAM228B-like [Styela clava]
MMEVTKALSKGSIKFYTSNPLMDFQSSEKRRSRDQSRLSAHSHGQTSSRMSRLGSTVSSLGQMRNIENWINEKSLKRIQENHSIESLESRQLYMTVLKNEENFVHGIDEFLQENELLNLRRKELLYKEWHENVYEPTRRKIQNKIETEYPILDEKKREEYVKYLKYKNKKGDVFLDVMSKEEYDPMCLLHPDSPTLLKVQTPRLQDPLLAQERQRIDEERTISRCETGEILSDDAIRHRWLPALPLRPLGRHGTTCQTWLEMPLRHMESPIHVRSCKRMKRLSNASTINFDEIGNTSDNRKLLPLLNTTPITTENVIESPGKSPKQVTFTLPSPTEVTTYELNKDENSQADEIQE